MECCGHDGTFAMKKVDGFEGDHNAHVGKRAFDGSRKTQRHTWVTGAAH
jgi:hypothetical protein